MEMIVLAGIDGATRGLIRHVSGSLVVRVVLSSVDTVGKLLSKIVFVRPSNFLPSHERPDGRAK